MNCQRIGLSVRSACMLPLLAVGLLATPSLQAGTEPHPAVCRVVVEERNGQAFGSGTLIDAREGFGLVVTNWHVVRDAAGKIEVRFPSGFRSEARPVKLDETWDLAALVIWRPPAEPVRLAPVAPAAGEPLTIHGYGQGEYRQAWGRCTDYFSPKEGMPQELVELNVEARQGDSGGPIFNGRGELAGVLFGAGQGTTLGSFGGRVGTFLTTLGGDIGSGAPTSPVLAHSEIQAPRAPVPSPTSKAQDPFLLADTHAEASKVEGEPKAVPSPVRIAATKPAGAVPTAAHTRKPHALPMPTARPIPRSMGWGPTELGQLAVGNVPKTRERPVGIDWNEEGRTLLALFGLVAIAVQGVRVLV